MHKIENLNLEGDFLTLQGYTDKLNSILIVYSRGKKILEQSLNVTRPDVQSKINDYIPNQMYGFDYKVSGCKNSFRIVLKDHDSIKVIFKTHNYYLRKKGSKLKAVLKYILHGFKILWKDYHFIVPLSKWKEFNRIFYRKVIKHDLFDSRFYNIFSTEDYNKWLDEFETIDDYRQLEYNPKISILIPVYNIDPDILAACIDSVLQQQYQNFEICICDDHSTNKKTVDKLKEYEKKYFDKIKIVYREQNGHISLATNDALNIATGEFIGLLDNDDILSKNALYEVVKALNEDQSLDMIYSDEDKLNTDGKRCDPHFKPDFSLDTLYSHNYICHFTVLRTSIVRKIGGFRKGFEGAQDYDLFLRFIEQSSNVYHIPKILYHWRMVPGSTSMEISNKSYAVEAGKKAVEESLIRRGIKGTVECYYTSYIISYDIIDNPLVSIIIPTRDKVNILKNCIDSIIDKTDYKNYEILIIDNGSTEKDTLSYFTEVQGNSNIKVIRVDEPFNYSYLNNVGVKAANGDYIVLLNNDIEIIDGNWLKVMLGYATQEHVGAVGPKLLFGNNKIQHAGVVLGVGTGHIANHAFYLEDEHAVAPAGRLIVPYNYSAVTGACIMVSKEKYLSVNGLEEKLAVNYNDIDFCLKLLKKGLYNVFLPQVKLYHLESVSRGKINNESKIKQYEGEKAYMEKHWMNELKNDRFYNSNYSKHSCFKLDKKGVTYEE